MSAAIVISSALAGVCVALTAAGLLWQYRNQWLAEVGGARRPGTPRYPVVLVHGVVGFDEITVGTTRHEYFRGIAERLRQRGVEVYRPRMPNGAAISVRARHLARWIEDIPAERVNIIAHSMGGLDARYAISHLGIGHRVASLITIGTPHRGTPLADIGTRLSDRFGLKSILRAAGIDVGGFYDITTRKARDFNTGVRNVGGVRYGCVVANVRGTDGGPGDLHPLLRPGHRYLEERDGPNDGLIPTSSQVWGEVIDEIDADHWAQIGWSKHFDAPAFYDRLVTALGTRGL